MRHQQAAARSKGETLNVIILAGVLGNPVDLQTLACRFADGETADLAGRRHISLHERRGNGQCARDVVETTGGIVGRQVLRGIDIKIKQILDRIRVLRAV